MSLQIGSYSLGKHVFFFRAGDAITVPAAGTGSAAGAATVSNKPDPTDPLYTDLGAIADWDSEIKTMGDEKILAPSPGRLQLKNIIEKGAEQTEKFTTQELSALALEIIYRTTQKLTSAGGVFNPNSAPPRTGWLHTELYDQNNNFAMNLDLWGLLRVTGGMGSKEGGIVKPAFEFNVFYSTLNVGLINSN